MNEEEIIDYLKNSLNDEFNFKHATRQKDKMAIQGLLDLYKKEKEKDLKKDDMIFLLNSEYKRIRDEIKALKDADFTTIYMDGYYDGAIKWKNKIKTIIKLYDNSKTELVNLPNGTEICLSDCAELFEYLRGLLSEEK